MLCPVTSLHSCSETLGVAVGVHVTEVESMSGESVGTSLQHFKPKKTSGETSVTLCDVACNKIHSLFSMYSDHEKNLQDTALLIWALLLSEYTFLKRRIYLFITAFFHLWQPKWLFLLFFKWGDGFSIKAGEKKILAHFRATVPLCTIHGKPWGGLVSEVLTIDRVKHGRRICDVTHRFFEEPLWSLLCGGSPASIGLRLIQKSGKTWIEVLHFDMGAYRGWLTL